MGLYKMTNKKYGRPWSPRGAVTNLSTMMIVKSDECRKPLALISGLDRLAIGVKNGGRPLVTQRATPGARPFLHPLLSPDGRQVLTENEPPHHPWQQGLYIGLNDVNGVGFWTEGKNPATKDKDGSFHPELLMPPVLDEGKAKWQVNTSWHSPDGMEILNDTQYWSLRTGEDFYFLELTWELTAGNQEVRFGEHSYGGLFLRMGVSEKRPPIFLNSEGDGDHGAAEGRRAKWCALSVEEQNEWSGLAIMDHPENASFPSPWRVDGQYGFGPSPCRLGEWNLGAGEKTLFRYGVLSYLGKPDSVFINQHFKKYSGVFV